MRKSSPLTEQNEKANRVGIVGASGLIGISLIILQGLLSAISLDVPQFISLVAFSLSIPLLTCFIITAQYEISYKVQIRFWSDLLTYFFVVGFITTIIGVNAAIWHVSWIIGLVFLSASILALLVFLGYFMEEEFYFTVDSNKTTDAKKPEEKDVGK